MNENSNGRDPAGELQYTKRLPVIDDADVLVVGGGPSGLAAAVASARTGARTRLVERYGFLGGNLTAGLVGPCMTSFSLDGREQLIRGVFEEFVQAMVRMGGALHPGGVDAGSAYSSFIVHGHDKVTPFEPEAAKMAAQELCTEAGVDILFHCLAVDALTEPSDNGVTRVNGVVFAGKGGLHVQSAKVYVDCTADGDLAAFSGGATRKGRDSDGLMQPLTLFFRLRGIDDEVVETYVRDHPEEEKPFSTIVKKAREEGRFPAPRLGVGLYKTLEPGVWRINTGRILKRDGSDAFDLTKAELEARVQTYRLIEFFRENLPGFETCSLLDTATQIGVRETRRIVGEYELEYEDLRSGRAFEDLIGLAAYPLDIHDPTGPGSGLSDKPTANVYGMPYGVLVPKDRDGLLVAGRAISATHEALGAVRVMPPCFALGQAAGVAAGLCVRLDAEPRDLPYPQLRDELLSQGAYLGQQTAPPSRDQAASS